MFDRFGEMNSYTEINELAINLRKEGDRDSLLVLCKENGIDTEDGEDFLDGAMVQLTSAKAAALGKISVEVNEFKGYKQMEIVQDWVEYIKLLVMDDENIALAVRRKGKNLVGCTAELLKYAYKNCYEIDSAIVKAAGIGSAKVKLGMPGAGTAKRLIREYYTR